jgi:flagellar assembly protein FliH
MEPVSFDQLEALDGAAVTAGRGADRVARALAELERERRAALEQAREEGYAAGLAEARAQLAPAADALALAAAGVEAALEEFTATAERRAVELALLLAERVVGEALQVRPELVLSAVTGALRASGERDQLVVEVNPEDLALVQAGVGEVASRVGGIHRLEVVPERRVPRGGCIVRTLEGEVDARVAEKLELAREALADALRASPDASPDG